jgi:hypothetical protein
MTLMEAATTSTNTVPPAPPQIPSELIGIVLTGLITGATAIIVAIVQRNRGGRTTAESSSSPFTLKEADWNETRNRSLTTESGHKSLCERFDGHIRDSDTALNDIREDIAYIKGQLGIK